jgi:hypothetical protein
MKLTLALVLVICGFLVSCSYLTSSKAPSFEQMETALDKFIKKDNPEATATIVGTTPSERYIPADFQFTNFSHKDKAGAKQTIASGKGLADFWRSPDGKWKLDKVTINGESFQADQEIK